MTNPSFAAICFMLIASASVGDAQWATLGDFPKGWVSGLATFDGEIFAGNLQGGVYKLAGQPDSARWLGVGSPEMDTLKVWSMASDEHRLYVGVESDDGYARLFSSTDGGRTWSTDSVWTESAFSYVLAIEPLGRPGEDSDVWVVVLAADDWFWTAYGVEIYRLSGDGRFLRPALLQRFNTLASAITRTDSTLFVCLPYAEGEPPFLRSNDNGVSWRPTGAGLLGQHVTELMEFDGVFLAATELPGAIHQSTDGGETWERTWPMDGHDNQRVLMASFGREIYAASFDDGVFRSSDTGSTWVPMAQTYMGPTNTLHVVSDLGDGRGPTLLAGSFGCVWYHPLELTAAAAGHPDEFPSEILLRQNYPNPFNPSTTIRLELPERGFTELVLYDLLGREVETILRGELEAGRHEVEIDGSRLASGVYHYVLVSGTHRAARSCVLMK